MPYEVELKFPVADMQAIEAGLTALGATILRAAGGAGFLFRPSPAGFRSHRRGIAIAAEGLKGYITYKGPKLDAATKTRREIELPLGEGPDWLAAWRELLEVLGFTPVAEVRKSPPQGPGFLARPAGRGVARLGGALG